MELKFVDKLQISKDVFRVFGAQEGIFFNYLTLTWKHL